MQKLEFLKPISVLLVEDTQVDKRLLQGLLRETGSHIKMASRLSEAQDLLGAEEFDVILLDLNLPDSHGVATLETLSRTYPAVAIVVNTGAYEDELGISTLSHGAQDFLIKGKYNGYILSKSLRYAIERKRLDQELLNAYTQLKDAQQQLVQAEKLRVVGGLASGVAHEVKNPLATILYGVTFLKETLPSKDEKIQLVLQNIRDAIGRADRIISDLLDFSSLKTLKKNPENINQIVEMSVALIQHEVTKNHTAVKCQFDPANPRVLIDRNRIEQVIVNLLLNAIHAMGDKGELTIITKKIKVPADPDSICHGLARSHFKKGDDAILVQIEDSGEGIPRDQIDKVFDPFFTTKRGKGGVGLGLSVSRNIMEIHEGDLFLDNKKSGKGACATLVFHFQS